MKRGLVAVEGHGDIDAASNLIHRMSSRLDLSAIWTVRRAPKLNTLEGITKLAERARVDKNCSALLVLRDEDDGCPKDLGPKVSAWLADLSLPIPAATVLLRPEFEVLFLPCIEQMAGKVLGAGGTERPGLLPGTSWQAETWESIRGVKEWLSQHYPENRVYKPTTDQLPLTQMLDLDALSAADVPCFGTLERALCFLRDHWGEPLACYPPAML